MSALAPTLQAFFTERLCNQMHASPHTVAAYRDAWRLLLGFVERRAGKAPSRLDLADVDTKTIAAFLDHLEHERGNSVRTRNARLAAIRSFFRFASLRHPEHAGLIAQVLAIPTKRGTQTEVSYLVGQEIDALLEAPDRSSWTGRRDHALLDLAVETGLRVSELTGLRNCDVELGAGAHVRCSGKGRKNRCTPPDPQAHHRRHPGVDAGTPRWPRGSPLPQPPRWQAQPRSRQRPCHQARRQRCPQLPVPGGQAPDSPRPPAQLRHGAANKRNCSGCIIAHRPRSLGHKAQGLSARSTTSLTSGHPGCSERKSTPFASSDDTLWQVVTLHPPAS